MIPVILRNDFFFSLPPPFSCSTITSSLATISRNVGRFFQFALLQKAPLLGREKRVVGAQCMLNLLPAISHQSDEFLGPFSIQIWSFSAVYDPLVELVPIKSLKRLLERVHLPKDYSKRVNVSFVIVWEGIGDCSSWRGVSWQAQC